MAEHDRRHHGNVGVVGGHALGFARVAQGLYKAREIAEPDLVGEPRGEQSTGFSEVWIGVHKLRELIDRLAQPVRLPAEAPHALEALPRVE